MRGEPVARLWQIHGGQPGERGKIRARGLEFEIRVEDLGGGSNRAVDRDGMLPDAAPDLFEDRAFSVARETPGKLEGLCREPRSSEEPGRGLQVGARQLEFHVQITRSDEGVRAPMGLDLQFDQVGAEGQVDATRRGPDTGVEMKRSAPQARQGEPRSHLGDLRPVHAEFELGLAQ